MGQGWASAALYVWAGPERSMEGRVGRPYRARPGPLHTMEGGLSGHLATGQGQPTTKATHDFTATLPLSDRLVWFLLSANRLVQARSLSVKSYFTCLQRYLYLSRFSSVTRRTSPLCAGGQARPCKAGLGLAGMELTFPIAALVVLRGALPTPMTTSSF